MRGLGACTGDVVCFLDADDYWSPDYLARIGEIYDTRRDIDFVFSDIRCSATRSSRMGFADRSVDLGYTAISTYMLLHWYGAPTSALSLRLDMARRVLDLPEDLRAGWRFPPTTAWCTAQACWAGARSTCPPARCITASTARTAGGGSARA